MISLIQHFEADFLWKVSLKILNSGIIPKNFTHVEITRVSSTKNTQAPTMKLVKLLGYDLQKLIDL